MSAGVSIPPPGAKAGFTLVEMLAALVAAAVLVMTMGSMLWYGFLGLNRTKQAVALQRDMRTSMAALAQMTHSATGMSYSTSGVYVVWFSNRPPASVYTQSTSNLFFDPNTTAAGDGLQLANGTLKRFSVSITTNLATVVLALGNPRDTISNQVVFFKRN
jgi:prepilin-type N-terminal cleavage/methylation domain-containing protein